ncbi:meiosis inhibitor protein 1-like isoform X1 [Xyrichtys novacula]|uniref:Meiosis inhibitor protein 1-like isoform X1 n=1 Tax=Xyrichtys novacula TaxID=13765 RepID=A0AAV1GRF4_XYRNO|nr:meiosis inhibitor protein 1-like isoform X1 [Xyrichtys novacula]
MSGEDIIHEKIHFRHDPKWSGRLGPAEGGGLLLCVACVIEMIESDDISSVRKSFVLSGTSSVLKCSPGVLRELLQQDHRVCLRFTASLLGMLHSEEDPTTLGKVEQVLVQLLLELQSEVSFRFVLDEIHKQLSDQLSMKSFLPIFKFLGSLLEAVPNLGHTLVTHYGPLLDHLCSSLLYPDEMLKALVLFVWLRLLGSAGGSAAQSLPTAIRDRVCVLLLQTLANASSPQLINNCAGLLLLLVQLREAVSVLMTSFNNQVVGSENQIDCSNNSQTLSQNEEQQTPDHCPLPLILKKLLLSGDETLQAMSAKCIASVLVHSSSQYSAPFIEADIPEFLFDRLASSSNEVLLWSVYSCLVVLTEDPLFFSQCHSVYGIESLVRSLKETLRLTNMEVPIQGLRLLTEILERQPPNVRLFPSSEGFVAVSEAVVAGVSSTCMPVVTQATMAASALLRLNHQSIPVQYRQIEGLIEAITNRFSELTPPHPKHHRGSASLRRSDLNSQAFRSEGFLLQALVCFQAACRLAEECASDPVLKENTFTAPSKHSNDTLDSLCQSLLHCCDSVWIPTVTRMYERAPNAQILQHFYSILSSQFTLLPPLMPVFAKKLASSGFFRLALEHKGHLCAGDRNPNLNAACCGFLKKLSMCLLAQSDLSSGSYQHDFEQVENLLLYNLPSLCYHLCDWPSLLREAPGLQLCEYKGPRATQYCLLIMLHLALQQGDRLLPDHTVFSSVVWLLHSVQEQGSCAMPLSALRSALYLLAVTQDKSPSLDGARLNCISKALSSCQSFSALYIHHPALLHFICRYSELAEKFGSLVLEFWLSKKTEPSDAQQAMADLQEKREKKESQADERWEPETDRDTAELLTVIEKHPAVTLTLLDMVCNRETLLAERALGVLEVVLHSQQEYEADLCTNLRPVLLQALQKLSMENMGHGLGQGHSDQVNSLPLVLKLLCVMQASDPSSSPSHSKMDGVYFKLLYHVSNIAGKLKPADTGSLLPALNYLYCCLSLSLAHNTDRAVSMLLSNSGLMDQLQSLLSSSSSSSAPSLSSSACPPPALLCCCHLLLSSLITLQHFHSTQVHKSLRWSLDAAVQRLLLQKRNTDNLLLVSYLKLLQALLDVDLASAVVCVDSGSSLVGPRPLGVEDGALYPLGARGAKLLSTALIGLLLQKQELLLRATIKCLSSLLGFLQRKSPTTAKYVVCQPWSRFLLCVMSSGESCCLHPAILRFITLLLQHSSTALLWEPDLLQVMEAAERRGVKELSEDAAQALRQLFTQIQVSVLRPPPTEEHKQRMMSVMESLGLQMQAESCSSSLPSNVLCVGDVFICVCDFIPLSASTTRSAPLCRPLLTMRSVCAVVLALAAAALSSAESDTHRPRHDSNLEIYKRLFETKRKDQLNALKNLVELNDINQQYKIIDIMLKGLFKVLEDSRQVLVAANMRPDDPFPMDDKIKEAYSHVVENTAFFGDVALRFPRIVHHYYDRNPDWGGLLRWGLNFCNQTGVFTGGVHQHVLTLMSQELGITEKTPDFSNPYRTERDDVLHTAEAFQKILREEEKRRRKEEKRKEIRKGPRISRSRTEL